MRTIILVLHVILRRTLRLTNTIRFYIKGVTKYYVMHLTDILTGYIVFKIVILSLVNPHTI